MPGFFGNQAIRLLREFWGGIMEPGRREQGAKLLADELFSMFQSETPLESTVPVTIISTSDQPALRVINNREGDSFVVDGGNIVMGGSNITLGGFVGGSQNFVIGGQNVTNFMPPVSNITIGDVNSVVNIGGQQVNLGGGDTQQVTIRLGDIIVELPDGSQVPLEEYIAEHGGGGGGGGATSSFLGRVVSGSGDTYTVDLYGEGSGQSPTDQVTATVPQIHPSEVLPAGTWIAAVHRIVRVNNNGQVVTTYEFQPPIWL